MRGGSPAIIFIQYIMHARVAPIAPCSYLGAGRGEILASRFFFRRVIQALHIYMYNLPASSSAQCSCQVTPLPHLIQVCKLLFVALDWSIPNMLRVTQSFPAREDEREMQQVNCNHVVTLDLSHGSTRSTLPYPNAISSREPWTIQQSETNSNTEWPSATNR